MEPRRYRRGDALALTDIEYRKMLASMEPRRYRRGDLLERLVVFALAGRFNGAATLPSR